MAGVAGPTRLFIEGEFVDAADGATIGVTSPHDGGHLAEVAEARAVDVDRAVAAARSAFHGGAPPRPPSGAAAAEAGRRRRGPRRAGPAESTHRRSGTRPAWTCPARPPPSRYFGGMADKLEGSVIPVEQGFLNYVVREPVGVVGQIVPWNFPLMFCSWKMGPALAAGNTVVLKPAD